MFGILLQYRPNMCAPADLPSWICQKSVYVNLQIKSIECKESSYLFIHSAIERNKLQYNLNSNCVSLQHNITVKFSYDIFENIQKKSETLRRETS
jgi:hypothetical protein